MEKVFIGRVSNSGEVYGCIAKDREEFVSKFGAAEAEDLEVVEVIPSEVPARLLEGNK